MGYKRIRKINPLSGRYLTGVYTNTSIGGPQLGQIGEVADCVIRFDSVWVEYVARRKVPLGETAVPQHWGRHGHLSGGQKLVGLQDVVDIVAVYTDSDAHIHELDTLVRSTVGTQKIGPLEGPDSMTDRSSV